MKNSIFSITAIFLLSFVFIPDTKIKPAEEEKSKVKEPVDYINPNIGGIGHLLVATDPVVQLPEGSVKLSSNPWPEI